MREDVVRRLGRDRLDLCILKSDENSWVFTQSKHLQFLCMWFDCLCMQSCLSLFDLIRHLLSASASSIEWSTIVFSWAMVPHRHALLAVNYPTHTNHDFLLSSSHYCFFFAKNEDDQADLVRSSWSLISIMHARYPLDAYCREYEIPTWRHYLYFSHAFLAHLGHIERLMKNATMSNSHMCVAYIWNTKHWEQKTLIM
jgi:hypothetical protein